MTDIEDKLRQTLSLHLDPVAAPRSLPSRVRTRVQRGRAVLIGASVLAATAAAVAVASAIPLLGRETQAPAGPPRPSPVEQRTASPPITLHNNGRIAYSLSTNRGMELHTIRPDGSRDQVIPTPPGLP
jgi:hypothetical protein